jgi:hypothetical protein
MALVCDTLQPSGKKKDDDDDQEDAGKTDATVAKAVTVPAEATTEATGKEDDEENDEDDAQRRHEYLPMASASALNLLAAQRPSKTTRCDDAYLTALTTVHDIV